MQTFDFIKTVESIEKRFPKTANLVGAKMLGLASPFNAHLKAKLVKWTPTETEFRITCHRSIRNHLGGIHAGALFTLGETCAGFTILKSFPISKYRPILTDVQVEFLRQARGKTKGIAKISKVTLDYAYKGLEAGDPQILKFVTEIYNEKNELAAKVQTSWQVKAWTQVKFKNKN